MDRATRDKFASPTSSDNRYDSNACLETPPDVFERLRERFDFDVDLCANEHNHLCEKWFGPGHVLSLHEGFELNDALTVDWHRHVKRCGFGNPVYGADFVQWYLTAALMQFREHSVNSVHLLPMRASSWFQDLVLPHYSALWYVKERIEFLLHGRPRVNPRTGKGDSALFDSIVVIFHTQFTTSEKRPRVWSHKTGKLS